MKKKTNVLLVGPNLNTFGGIVCVVKQIMASNLNKEYTFFYLPIESSSTNFLLKKAHQFILLPYAMYVIVKHRIELVHIHTASRVSFWFSSLALFASKLLHKKVILQIHGAYFEKFYSESVLNYLIKYVLGSASKVVVLSNYWFDFFKNIVPIQRLVVVGNSVCVDKYMKHTPTLNKKVNLLFVGGDWKRKGLFDLVAVLHRLINSNKYFHLNVVGHGPVLEFENFIQELGLVDHVSIFEMQNTELMKFYKKNDIFILPSYAEGLPIVILEAMAAGLPVISTKVGAIPEVIKNGANGFLIPPGDLNSLEYSISRLASDTNLWRKMSVNNIRKVQEQYNFPKFEKDLNAVYVSVLGS